MPKTMLYRIKEKARRDAFNERMNVLERLVREDGADKRSIADTLHHVVKMLTGREPNFENKLDSTLPRGSLKSKLREQDRRDKQQAAIDELKTYIVENNLRDSNVCAKLTRLGIVNCIIDHIREKFGLGEVKKEPSQPDIPKVDMSLLIGCLQANTPVAPTSTAGTSSLPNTNNIIPPIVTPFTFFTPQQHLILSRVLSLAEYSKLFASYPVQQFVTATPKETESETTDVESI